MSATGWDGFGWLDVLVVGDAAVVDLHGEVDAAVAPRLRERVQDLVAAGVRSVTLQAAAVTFIDGAAVGVIASLARDLRLRGGTLVVAEASRAVRRVAALTGLDRVVPIAVPKTNTCSL